MKEAILYHKLDGMKVQCYLCAHKCVIKPGSLGFCSVRENVNGVLYSKVYGKLCSTAVDPIEKKPLFHFLPGSKTLSISTVGCNFKCLHCQNASISQFPKEHNGQVFGTDVSAERIVEIAQEERCDTISYTYTEPTIFMEFALDCARIAKQRGLKNVFVSNGYMTPESAATIIPHLDANNIDLKGDDEFYKKICSARVGPVKDTIKMMLEQGVWVEVTTLVIPGLNDSEPVLKEIAEFIKSLDTAIPWHVTAFYPTHKLADRRPTPENVLVWARRIGFEAGLKFVYVGNIANDGGENTYCPRCKNLLIERQRFTVKNNSINNGNCPNCDAYIEGIWKDNYKTMF
ncbi:radical SAM domain-containing protein [Candidatus Magnetoovum chiemensis]|nr:radical SAM domain-containing protein [Candidatus Magnetoovum chiemensis]